MALPLRYASPHLSNCADCPQTVVEVLFTSGRSTLQEIRRAAKLPENTVSEALIVLIQHSLVRFATVDEGAVERTCYECFFEDVYPLLRYGSEVQMVGKHTGSAEVIPNL